MNALINLKSLKAIYFGTKINPVDMEIICLILAGQTKDVNYYRTKIDMNSYNVYFEQIEYTSYIDKKLICE